MAGNMLLCLKNYDSSQVGIIFPFHIFGNRPFSTENECTEVFLTMAPGNIINLAIFKAVAPFTEDLFIDFDYCLRMHKRGYKVIETSATLLFHKLGNIRTYYLFSGKKFHVKSSPIIQKTFHYTK